MSQSTQFPFNNQAAYFVMNPPSYVTIFNDGKELVIVNIGRTSFTTFNINFQDEVARERFEELVQKVNQVVMDMIAKDQKNKAAPILQALECFNGESISQRLIDQFYKKPEVIERLTSKVPDEGEQKSE